MVKGESIHFRMTIKKYPSSQKSVLPPHYLLFIRYFFNPCVFLYRISRQTDKLNFALNCFSILKFFTYEIDRFALNS